MAGIVFALDCVLTSPDCPLVLPLALLSEFFLATGFCVPAAFFPVTLDSGESCFLSLQSWDVDVSESLDEDESEPLEDELLLLLSLLEAEELSVELRVPG